MQQLSDAVTLKLGSAGISDKYFSAMDSDTAVQPAVKVSGEGLIVEHVT